MRTLFKHLKLAPRHTEYEFLPAALEIQETPPAPLGRAILWAIVLFFSIAVLWACIGKVDIVAVAQGKIIPSGRVKVIQPLESGVVREIPVNEGQYVEKGQRLLELDSTISAADRERLQNDLLMLRLDYMRTQTLLNAVKMKSSAAFLELPLSLENKQASLHLPAVTPPLSKDMPGFDIQQQRLNKQYHEYRARLSALHEQINQQHAERDAIDNRIQQLSATIPLISERAEAMHRVVEQGVVSRAQWLEIEEQRINQVKERDIQKNKYQELNAAIKSTQEQQQALTAQFESQWLGELNDIESKMLTLAQELKKTEQRHTLQKLLAPVTGKVQQLAVHTIGGVVTPAQTLMLIVPDEGALQVEAWVENKDIGFVETGYNAEIKIETFPFTKYGTLQGKIANLSNDAIQHETFGLVYAAQVTMEKSTLTVNGKDVNLSPGMAVTVEVNLGKRRLIEYLISPLLRFKDESIKER